MPPYLAYSPPYLAYSQILGIPPPCLAYSAPNLLPHFFGLTALPGIEESQLTLWETQISTLLYRAAVRCCAAFMIQGDCVCARTSYLIIFAATEVPQSVLKGYIGRKTHHPVHDWARVMRRRTGALEKCRRRLTSVGAARTRTRTRPCTTAKANRMGRQKKDG